MSEICTVNDESLARAVEIIHDGGLVVIPTDTVYGVACDPRNIEAIRKVFAAKQRPKYKSLQVLQKVVFKLGQPSLVGKRLKCLVCMAKTTMTWLDLLLVLQKNLKSSTVQK